LQQFVTGAILVQTLVPPPESLFGSFDLRYQGSVAAQVNAFNIRLAELAAKKGYVLVDVARLAGAIGLERWDDPQHWQAAKLPFAAEMISAYADLVARTLGAVYGKSRKCLVVDLDNTIWGGVIGDDVRPLLPFNMPSSSCAIAGLSSRCAPKTKKRTRGYRSVSIRRWF
jgi:predicted enzyme involved in methoxymalonyl-ACP biosynthesis